MIGLILKGLKLASTIFVVLIISQIIGQIPIGKHRICDVTGSVVRSHWIQDSIHWISKKFDFVEGHGMNKQLLISNIKKETGYESQEATVADAYESTKSNDSNESNHFTLSGLLKKH